MKKLALALVVAIAAALAGALAAWRLSRPPPPPDEKAIVAKVREVARLETLDVTLYKKIDFSPDPTPQAGLWPQVSQWARYNLHPPRGRAIVFAHAHLGVDLSALSERTLRVRGRRVEVVLPRPTVQVELLPGETEVIGSNLDSAETAQLFALARQAFARQVADDAALREKALESARRSLRSLFFQAGFAEVAFVDALPVALVQ